MVGEAEESELTPLDRVDLLVHEAARLVEDIKEGFDQISIAEAHRLYSRIRETEGWLKSARLLLEPPNVL